MSGSVASEHAVLFLLLPELLELDLPGLLTAGGYPDGIELAAGDR